jgi:hypothetical protein
VKLEDISGTKKKEYLKVKLMNLKLTVGTKILGTCIGASVTLRRVTSLRLIWLQTPTVVWLGGGTFSWLLNVHGVNYVRQTEIHTAVPLVPEPCAFVVELDIKQSQITRY